jgi:murein DD-endopeptidase MepM/ murein hydrolase activator NlpD
MATTNNISIDFDNPLEPGFDDISLDVFDLQDAKSAISIKNEAMDVFTRRNVFKGVTEYKGLVISSWKDLTKNPGYLDQIAFGAGVEERQIAFKIHIPALHAMLDNPCDMNIFNKYKIDPNNAQAEKETIIETIIQQHPWFVTTAFISDIPLAGDWITVKFTKGPSGGRMINGEIIESKLAKKKINLASVCSEDVVAIFNNYNQNAVPLGSTGSPANTTPPALGAGLGNETSLTFMYPFEGSYKITSPMKFWRDISDKKGGRIQGSHTGVDWGMPVGVPLYASVEGTVIAGTKSVTIHAIDPDTGRSYFAVYHHLSKISVSNGDFVEQGDPIGLSGNTGRSTGPHLHFEIRRDTYKTTWKASANGSPEEIAKFEASCIDPLVGP